MVVVIKTANNDGNSINSDNDNINNKKQTQNNDSITKFNTKPDKINQSINQYLGEDVRRRTDFVLDDGVENGHESLQRERLGPHELVAGAFLGLRWWEGREGRSKVM